jgi:hypothetical protein
MVSICVGRYGGHVLPHGCDHTCSSFGRFMAEQWLYWTCSLLWLNLHACVLVYICSLVLLSTLSVHSLNSGSLFCVPVYTTEQLLFSLFENIFVSLLVTSSQTVNNN